MQPWALYNEIDDYAANWLENLIARGHIAPGIVDRRSIEDLRTDDLRGFRQVHFFAGIGVWSYALRRAGISDDTALWTGSCPCQPFSAAGKGAGVVDERHLWPAWHHLIREHRPPLLFGEQVASKDGLGWLDLVSSDLEAEGYAFGAVDTCSAGSGAPHIRQRLRFVTYDRRSAPGRVEHANRGRAGAKSTVFGSDGGKASEGARANHNTFIFDGAGATGGLGHHHHQGLEGFGSRYQAEIGRLRSLRSIASAGELGGLADAGRTGDECLRGPGETSGASRPSERETSEWEWCGLADWSSSASSELAHDEIIGRDLGTGLRGSGPGERRWDVSADDSAARKAGGGCSLRPGPTNGFWRDADWVFCRDERWRAIEPGTFPLAHGAPSRVGRLRAYGNAVDAEATTDFLEAWLERATIDLAPKSAGLADQFADLLS